MYIIREQLMEYHFIYYTLKHIMRTELLDKITLDYVYDEIAKLIVHNFQINNCQIVGDYSRGKDLAYKEVLRIITDILNNNK
jgi:hypothetical protein